jgi:hypothetical protein
MDKLSTPCIDQAAINETAQPHNRMSVSSALANVKTSKYQAYWSQQETTPVY